MKDGWMVEIRQHPASQAKELFIFRRGLDMKVDVLQADMRTTISYDAGAINIAPTFKFTSEIFQGLVDAIQGKYKPSEARFTDGKLEATERHLADLQKLVFKIS